MAEQSVDMFRRASVRKPEGVRRRIEDGPELEARDHPHHSTSGSTDQAVAAALPTGRRFAHSPLRPMKACRLCRETKPLDDFHRMKSSPDGRQYRCKTCALEVAKRYTTRRISNADASRHRRAATKTPKMPDSDCATGAHSTPTGIENFAVSGGTPTQRRQAPRSSDGGRRILISGRSMTASGARYSQGPLSAR